MSAGSDFVSFEGKLGSDSNVLVTIFAIVIKKREREKKKEKLEKLEMALQSHRHGLMF